MPALITPLLALAISAQAPALQPVTLDRRVVAPKLPNWTALESLASAGDAIVTPNGLRPKWGTTWAEIAADATISDSGAVVWPTQIVVLDRADLLSLRGLWRQWRTDFFTEDLRALEQETALFVNLVRIATKGQVKIVPTWTLEEDVLFGDEDSLMSVPMLDAYLRPLLPNGHRSVLVVHPAVNEREVLGAVGGTPYASLAYYKHADAARPGQMARAMFNAWAATLPYHLRDAGWQVPDSVAWPLPGPLSPGAPIPLTPVNAIVPKGAYAVLTGNRANGFGYRLPVLSAEPQAWEAVQDDPWSRLPRIDVGSTAKGNSVLLGLADWMSKTSGAKATAIVESSVVFDGPMSQPTPTPGASLLSDEVRNATKLTFSPGQAEGLPASGYFELKTVGDNDRGSVAEIRESSVRRKGWVRMLGAADPSKTPVLEFWLKPRAGVRPIDVWFKTTDGDSYSVRMFGSTLSEVDRGSVVEYLQLQPEPVWQRVVIEFGKLSSKPIDSVYLRVPPESERELLSRVAPPAWLVDDFEYRESATATVTPKTSSRPIPPAFDSTLGEDRARAIAIAPATSSESVAKLLSDSDDLVRLNALIFFKRNNLQAPIDSMIPLVTSFNSRIAGLAAEQLAKSGKAEAFEAIRRATQFGLSDFTKGAAASAIPKLDERKVLGELTVLLHMKSATGRAAAVAALGRQAFKEADLVMLSFLYDTDPRVRYQVVQDVRLEQEAVLNRIQEVARLDLSESVRALANARLLSSTIGTRIAPVVAQETSPWVRAESVRLAAAGPARKALALSLAGDADPSVAVAALEALKSDPAELSNLKVTSRDPRVLLAWLQLAEVAKMPVPADVLVAAEASRWSQLSSLAKKLKGGS